MAMSLTVAVCIRTSSGVPGDSMVGLVVALCLLGVGWNVGLITGTALVIDATVPATRPRVQGSIDLLIALAGAGGGALSGVIKAQTSYPTLALGGVVLALTLLPVVAWSQRSPRRAAPTTVGISDRR